MISVHLHLIVLCLRVTGLAAKCSLRISTLPTKFSPAAPSLYSTTNSSCPSFWSGLLNRNCVGFDLSRVAIWFVAVCPFYNADCFRIQYLPRDLDLDLVAGKLNCFITRPWLCFWEFGSITVPCRHIHIARFRCWTVRFCFCSAVDNIQLSCLCCSSTPSHWCRSACT
jgi:hypothetical protein